MVFCKCNDKAFRKRIDMLRISLMTAYSASLYMQANARK